MELAVEIKAIAVDLSGLGICVFIANSIGWILFDGIKYITNVNLSLEMSVLYRKVAHFCWDSVLSLISVHFNSESFVYMHK